MFWIFIARISDNCKTMIDKEGAYELDLYKAIIINLFSVQRKVPKDQPLKIIVFLEFFATSILLQP